MALIIMLLAPAVPIAPAAFGTACNVNVAVVEALVLQIIIVVMAFPNTGATAVLVYNVLFVFAESIRVDVSAMCVPYNKILSATARLLLTNSSGV